MSVPVEKTIHPAPHRRFATISEVIRTARQQLPPHYWDHSAGGVGIETTLRRNRQMLESVAFRPRLMQGVGTPAINVTCLGLDLASPIVFAPVGTIALFAEHGATASAAVAIERQLLSFNSVMSSPSLEQVGRTGKGRVALQLYIRGGRTWLTDTIRQAEECGYVAVCVTADSIGGGTRDRDALNNFRGLAHTAHPNLPPDDPSGLEHQLTFTWDDLAWLRTVTSLPLLVKGITTVADARSAVECGVDAIYVSNHGGRALDGLPATIEVLPEVVDEVQDQAEVIVDSGFLRGADIVKALAFGARAVSLGRLQLWALAAGGEEALTQVVDMLEHEVRETLQLLGVASVNGLTRDYLRQAQPTRIHSSDYNMFQWAPMPQL
jgi:isopentenyl diphosphate isomerase/L-lactate dehydrogenase-like FMN-dependent dehydrogenase